MLKVCVGVIDEEGGGDGGDTGYTLVLGKGVRGVGSDGEVECVSGGSLRRDN